MPRLSVYLVRAALAHMGAGFLFGALILHHKGIPIYVWTWRLLTPHIEMMIFGWTMQFVMGMAFWILPRFTGGQRYGRVYLGWGSLILLNSGVILAAAGGWFASGWALLAGRLLTLIAVILFVIMIWPRVKPLSVFTAPQFKDKS